MAIHSRLSPLLPGNGVISALIHLCYFSLHLKAPFENLSAKGVFFFTELLIVIRTNVEMDQGKGCPLATQHSEK